MLYIKNITTLALLAAGERLVGENCFGTAWDGAATGIPLFFGLKLGGVVDTGEISDSEQKSIYHHDELL